LRFLWHVLECSGKGSTVPPKSQAQRKAMYAAASGHSTLGIPKSVGKDFTDADRPGKLPARITKKAHSPDSAAPFHKAQDGVTAHKDGSTAHADHMAARASSHATPHGKRIAAAHKGAGAGSISMSEGLAAGHLMEDTDG
jgi:hypothetical protein